jgi:hypothetical protein
MSDEINWDEDLADCEHHVEGPCRQCEAEEWEMGKAADRSVQSVSSHQQRTGEAMTFNSVAEVNAYYDSIPPLDITAELEACGGDPLSMANVMVRSLAEYINRWSVPTQWPAHPPKRGWWRRSLWVSGRSAIAAMLAR